jgi:hypothetical protein|nr:MAG TPA: hypothetical protein [Bacteriophage sp.]
MGYLDYAGLQYLWGKLKEKFAPKSHSHDDRYYTESEVNTLLASKVHEETITDARDLNTVKTTGIYHLKTTNFTNGPGITNHGTLIVDYTVGTPYQIYIPDFVNKAFRRNHNNSSSVWNAWSELKLTDTNTWRGIQNNLTSDSTTDSLSAAQGKALKALVDSKAPNGHTHYSISTIADNRNTNTAPNDYRDTLIFQGLKVNKKINSPSSDEYSYLLGLRGWYDSSGGNSHELAFNNTGVYWRNGSSEWGGWSRIYADNYHPNADYATNAGSADKANSVDWSKVQNKPTTYPATSHTHPYLPISGGTVTGNTAITGSYLQVPMITGETSNDIRGTAQIKKAHGIQLGIPNRDYCNFYEYGGVWNFYKTKDSYTQESGDGVLIAKIDTNGVHANLIGTADSAKALSTTVTLTGGDGNTTGYRLVAQCGIGQWTNNRSMFFVKSRHQGSGFVVVTIGNNSGTVNQANAYAEIIYYGPQNSGSVISDTAWQVYVSADGKIGYLFWKYNDYSECNVQVINSAFTLSNGTWMTSIGSGYGACKAKTSINPSYTTQRVIDSGNGTWTSLAYSKSGMNYDDYTWLAGWNNYELRAVNKNQFATAGHDHDLNKMINKLSEGTSDPQDNDYYISQYSGGGTTTTTYHRRPIKALWNYIKGKTDAAYLKLTGGTISGALHLKQPNSGSYNENIRMHPSKSDWSSIVMCGSDNTGDSGTSAKTWGIFTNGGKFGISKNGNGVSAVGDASLVCGDNNVWKANGNELITSATIGSQTVSKANSATTASKLGTNAGSTTNPVYFKDGVPVAGTYTLSDASTKTVRTLTAQGPSGWKDAETDQKYVPDMAFMAYWNGAYSGTSSNLQYCDRGRFGTIITKGSGDYLPIGGGTLTGDLKFSDIGDTATSHKISWAGSTDGADIYYQTTAKDQGNLVLNLRDDANCYLRIASNGAFKSYFSPSDGNFHGNVNGNATSASGYTFKSQTSDPGANSSLATGTVLFVYE